MIAAGGRLDWPGLMRAGLGRLHLHPDAFWSLTPAELALMLGLDRVQPPMSRDRLAELSRRYPDGVPDARGQDDGKTGDEGDG